MTLTLRLPDVLARRLQDGWDDLPRRALEALAADGYRAGLLSAREVQEALGLTSRWETDAFLERAGALLAYDAADLADDRQALRDALGE